MDRINEWGRLLGTLAFTAGVALVFFGVKALEGPDESTWIVLASIPAALAVVALFWPLSVFKKPLKERDLGLPDKPSFEGKEPPMSADIIEELLEVVYQQGEIEQERTKAFSDRAGFLLGFAGVILALIGSEAKDTFEAAASLGTVGRPVGAWLLVAAGVMTVIAAVDALVVLLKRRTPRMTTEALIEYLEPRAWKKSKTEILYTQLRSRVTRVRRDREVNAQVRAWFNAGLISLLTGLLFLLIHLGVYLQRTVETPCERGASSGKSSSSRKSALRMSISEGEREGAGSCSTEEEPPEEEEEPGMEEGAYPLPGLRASG